MITIADLMALAGPAAIRAAGKPYTISPVLRPANFAGSYVMLSDPASGRFIPLTWSNNDEIRNVSERAKIELVTALLKNGIGAMDNMLAQDEPGDEGEDVVNDWSETNGNNRRSAKTTVRRKRTRRNNIQGDVS